MDKVPGKRESAHKKCMRSFQRREHEHEHRAGRGLAGCGRARATTAPHDAAEAQAAVQRQRQRGVDGEGPIWGPMASGPAMMIL